MKDNVCYPSLPDPLELSSFKFKGLSTRASRDKGVGLPRSDLGCSKSALIILSTV